MQNAMSAARIARVNAGNLQRDNLGESSSATTQRTGRTKRSGLPARQYIFFAQ